MGQDVQEAEPVLDAYFPDVQIAQSEALSWRVASVAASSTRNLPAAQLTQDTAPVNSEYFPAGQIAHVPCELFEAKDPAVQVFVLLQPL
jgi:hypothetical protein